MHCLYVVDSWVLRNQRPVPVSPLIDDKQHYSGDLSEMPLWWSNKNNPGNLSVRSYQGFDTSSGEP